MTKQREKYIFQDIGPVWQVDSQQSNFFDRRLSYAESIPRCLVEVAQGILSKVEFGKRALIPPISYYLVDTMTFNCFARIGRDEDHYHCAMSTSVIFGAMELACHYFSYAEFYPDLGDAEKCPKIQLETQKHPPLFQLLDGDIKARFSKKIDNIYSVNLNKSINSVINFSKEFQKRNKKLKGVQYFRCFDSILDMMMPECPVRRLHCIYMVDILMHFLWIHEINHVTSGHLRALQERLPSTASNFIEFSLGQFADDHLNENKDRLAMEFDADIDAAVITIALIKSDMDIESDSAPYLPQENRIELFAFTLVAFYAAVASEEYIQSGRTTHPPARLRFENIAIHAMGMLGPDTSVGEAFSKGYNLFLGLMNLTESEWIPDFFRKDDINALQSPEWFEIYTHRKNISLGYENYQMGNLKVFFDSIDKELKQSPLYQLGPEPDWWNK